MSCGQGGGCGKDKDGVKLILPQDDVRRWRGVAGVDSPDFFTFRFPVVTGFLNYQIPNRDLWGLSIGRDSTVNCVKFKGANMSEWRTLTPLTPFRGFIQAPIAIDVGDNYRLNQDTIVVQQDIYLDGWIIPPRELGPRPSVRYVFENQMGLTTVMNARRNISIAAFGNIVIATLTVLGYVNGALSGNIDEFSVGTTFGVLKRYTDFPLNGFAITPNGTSTDIVVEMWD